MNPVGFHYVDPLNKAQKIIAAIVMVPTFVAIAFAAVAGSVLLVMGEGASPDDFKHQPDDGKTIVLKANNAFSLVPDKVVFRVASWLANKHTTNAGDTVRFENVPNREWTTRKPIQLETLTLQRQDNDEQSQKSFAMRNPMPFG